VIAGDVVVDHHLYEGERGVPTMDNKRGVIPLRETGGAYCVHRLLQAAFQNACAKAENTRAEKLAKYQQEQSEQKVTVEPKYVIAPEEKFDLHFGITMPPETDPPCNHDAYAAWRPFPKLDEPKKSVWRANLVMGYGHEAISAAAEADPPTSCPIHQPAPLNSNPPARILVLDDAGFVFRHRASQNCWLLPQAGQPDPEWIVLKMSAPVAQGDLWNELIQRYADRLICVVSAKELRRECVSLSQGLSWEQTIEDLRDALFNNPAVSPLGKCRHLIVTFGMDGALWLDRTNAERPDAWLIYDAGGAEGEWEQTLADKGKSFGYHSCLVATIVQSLAQYLDLPPAKQREHSLFRAALAAGLNAKRDLLANGHGDVGHDPPNGFPVARLAAKLAEPAPAFSEIHIPWPATAADIVPEPWRIIEMSQRAASSTRRPSLLGLARQTVLDGTAALKRLPHARFGDLFTADRFEIEVLRDIRRALLEYNEPKPAKKPLSIGVFGPPGAGKSFGVREIAKHIFGKEAWREFNLSQFSDTEDLIGAFHQVRDLVLGGMTPVVFWDEFDSQDYKWLQYLLAPMQDGRFQEGQVNHAIGKCVFVFAGGTSYTYEEFGPKKSDLDAQQRFRLCKGPDFHSRLDAFYNVLGPNQRTLPKSDGKGDRELDPDDVCSPLRRAIMIRAKLASADDRLDFDPDLIGGLLEVPKYKHGARSLEKLVVPLRPVNGGPIRRSALPGLGQLKMHVDADCFTKILGRNDAFRNADVIETLAPAVHETWRELSREEGWKMQPEYDRPYTELGPVQQEENRAAARRIPEVLAMAGLSLQKAEGMDPSAKSHDAMIAEHLEQHLERLAEVEHDGWMAHKIKNGWRYDEARDDINKRHNALRPYANLSEVDKGKDRNSVRHFPRMAAMAGYRIVFLGQPGDADAVGVPE
jgi:hypothetical protein